MNSQSNQIILKVVFAGKSGVGKTSLLTRQSINEFTEKWIATIGVDFRIKHYKVGNMNVKAQLWDSAGQQRFRSIQAPYYKGAKAILLCFDLNDSDSFKDLEAELFQIKEKNLFQSRIYLIGCKSDLEPKVFTDEILMFAQRNQCSYFQTSAKQNEGVNQCFETIIKDCAQEKLQEMAFSRIQIQQKPVEKQTGRIKKTCC